MRRIPLAAVARAVHRHRASALSRARIQLPIATRDRATTTAATTAVASTRCQHCFITFATPAELAHHASHHCFPGAPEEIAARFPAGARVIDTVRGDSGTIIGPASNRAKAHASVAVRDAGGGVADVAISRLRIIGG